MAAILAFVPRRARRPSPALSAAEGTLALREQQAALAHKAAVEAERRRAEAQAEVERLRGEPGGAA